MSNEQGQVIEDPNPAQEAVAAINARQKDDEGLIFDEVVEFEKGFYRIRLSWLPKNGVIKLICRWPILIPSPNFGNLALTIGRINFGVRVGKFEFDERDGELCLRHSFILGDHYKDLTTAEQRSTLYCNMFVLSHEMMESHWDTFAKLSSARQDNGEDEEDSNVSTASFIVPDAAIHEAEDITEGTLGNIARAKLVRSEENCVVKHLKPRKNFTEEDRSTFQEEAELAHALHHPNVVPVRAVCLDPPQIVEPFYGESNLQKLLESNRATPMPQSTIFKLVLDICRGVNYIHECGHTHGRLRPNNIMIDDKGAAVVGDFGFTKTRKVILDGNTGPGENGALYAAPEVLFGKPTSAGTDVFSIGIILYQFLMPQAELLPPVVPELVAFSDGISADVEKLVRDCLHRDATKRPAVIDLVPILRKLASQ